MPVWVLMDYDEEVAVFSGISNSVVREDCEQEAIAQGLAAQLERGVALAPGVRIVCIED